MRAWLRELPDRFLRSSCLLCGASASHIPNLCAGCLADLPWLGPSCWRCAAPLPVRALCPDCQHRPPAYQRTLCPLRYASPASELVQQLKFQGKLAPAATLGHILADYVLGRCDTLPAYIVPVPLHPSRLRARGFNQALEIARSVARVLEIPVYPRALRRVRNTAAQSTLDRGKRRGNVLGAFTTARALPDGPLAGPLRIALVDDVMTTGFTASEAARALRRARVETVEVWCCLRAPSAGH